MAKLYDLYDGSKKVLASATSAEIREYTDKPKIKVASYMQGGFLISGKYKVIESDNQRKKRNMFTPSDIKEWDAACKRLKGVKGLDKIILKPIEV